jgi:hypothetical protein
VGISAKYLFCAFFLQKGGSGNLGERESPRQNIYSAHFFCKRAGAGMSAKYLFCAFFLQKGGSGNVGKIYLLRIFSAKRRERESRQNKSWQNISSADFFCKMAGLKKAGVTLLFPPNLRI